eukprot:gene7436-573_t
MFSKSLLDEPRLPTRTRHIVRHIVAFATQTQNCRMVDIVPKEHVGTAAVFVSHSWDFDLHGVVNSLEHVGTASVFVSHSWDFDLHDVVNSLVADFERRWQIYLTYRNRNQRGIDAAMVTEVVDADKKKKQDALVMEERKNLAGMDVFALQQDSHTSPPELPLINRLIMVIGRTVLMIDEDAAVLDRTWCLWEAWATTKCNRTLSTLGIPEGNYGLEGPDAYTPSDIDIAVDPAEQTSALLLTQQSRVADRHRWVGIEGPDAYTTSDIDVAVDPAEQTSYPQERTNLVAQFSAEVASINNRMTNINQLVCEALILTSKMYSNSYSQPVYKDVEAARGACRSIIDRYFDKAARGSCRSIFDRYFDKDKKDAKLLSNQDVELELWECLTFLHKQLSRMRYDPFWLKEIEGFAKLSHRSFATRFSGKYVDNLMHQAFFC